MRKALLAAVAFVATIAATVGPAIAQTAVWAHNGTGH